MMLQIYTKLVEIYQILIIEVKCFSEYSNAHLPSQIYSLCTTRSKHTDIYRQELIDSIYYARMEKVGVEKLMLFTGG